MSDLISRQWLLECVDEGWIKFDTEKGANIFIHLVRDIAPGAQPVAPDTNAGDTISRQAAIDVIEDFPHGCVWNVESMEDMADMIKALPSAQPEQSETKDATYWKKRTREYEEMLVELTTKIAKGMTVDSVVIKKDEIVFKESQPERKKGCWKHINEEEERAKHNGQLLGWMPWYCSECGCGVGKHQTAFCPNCGADMRGKQDE